MTLKGNNMIETKTWRSLENQAVRRRHAGDPTGAIASLAEAIGMTRNDAELISETATMLNYLAGICLSQGLLDPAEAAIREALQRTAARPIDYADNLLILAEVLHKEGRQKEAVEVADEGLRLVRSEYGWDHSYTRGVEELLKQLEIPFSNGWLLGFIPPRITACLRGLGRRFAKPHH